MAKVINGLSGSFGDKKRKIPLSLNHKGLLTVEEEFPKFNYSQLIVDMGAGFDARGNVEDLSRVKLPKLSDITKVLYAAHIGYCKAFKSEEFEYSIFADAIGINNYEDIFRIFMNLIGDEYKEKKPSNVSS